MDGMEGDVEGAGRGVEPDVPGGFARGEVQRFEQGAIGAGEAEVGVAAGDGGADEDGDEAVGRRGGECRMQVGDRVGPGGKAVGAEGGERGGVVGGRIRQERERLGPGGNGLGGAQAACVAAQEADERSAVLRGWRVGCRHRRSIHTGA